MFLSYQVAIEFDCESAENVQMSAMHGCVCVCVCVCVVSVHLCRMADSPHLVTLLDTFAEEARQGERKQVEAAAGSARGR